jgi:NIMA (never in mitosis gene a)-related kinase 2
LKPSNIFLKGKDYTVQVGDFGTSCSNLKSSTRVEDVGTLLYNSPEILENGEGKGSGGYDNRTDIWSFGCILYEMCNFDAPFNALTE